jgi:hypothetical protein
MEAREMIAKTNSFECIKNIDPHFVIGEFHW